MRRPHLSARSARTLAGIVAADLLQSLAQRTDLDPAVARDLRARLFGSLDANPATSRDAADPDQAMAEARALAANGQLTEQLVLATAGRGEETLAIAMLAVAADVPARVVRQAATLRSGKGIVSVVWKAGFSMRAAIALQAGIARLSPQAIVRAPFDGGFPMDTAEMRWQLAFLTESATGRPSPPRRT